jgi:oleate hydratase
MHAVYGLLGVERPIPAVYHAIADPAAALAAMKTLLG